MTTRTRIALALALAAAPSLARAQTPSVVSHARLLWQPMRVYLLEAANDAPDSIYSFRPTPAVRTFGEILAHVANSQKQYCAMALGEPAPSDDAERSARTKAAIIAALRESNTYCERAYALSDQAVQAMVDLYGSQRTKFFVLLTNVTHDSEHYGNIVTYLRINGIVPPSSKPGRGD